MTTDSAASALNAKLGDWIPITDSLPDSGKPVLVACGKKVLRSFIACVRVERRVIHLETRMSDYKRVPTSAEVWAVIRARHPEMRVFGSYSAPDGDQFGDPSKGKMFTSYGFEHGDFPVMEAQTTWDIDPEAPHKRPNERHEYWLCLPVREDV